MHDNPVAIRVTNVSKEFKLPHERAGTVKSLFVNMFRTNRTFERQKVLKGISFEVNKGEFLGIVGRNGGGKSTLLKLLAGIYAPNSGAIEVNGKLTPFIELGVGFNPELTGRENVYLNGALLGFDRKEMDKIYNDIVEFAELEKFMDQKLKNYSSGMQVRLAFSVAIQARTEILLIDEVLAVGDANFQKKCFDVFETFKKEGRTVIFISHSMQMVKRFCDRVLLISKGKIISEGDPSVVAAEYEMLNKEEFKDNPSRLAIENPREAHIVDTVLENFDLTDELLDLGAAEGRHAELLNSMDIKTFGVEPSLGGTKKLHRSTIYKNLKDIKKPQEIKGLLLLDNRKSVTPELLKATFKELNNGLLANVYRVYIHLPFDLYQEFNASKDKSSTAHLANPLDIATISQELHKYQFRQIKSEVYGIDFGVQYIEAVYDRFDDEKKESLWDSSKA